MEEVIKAAKYSVIQRKQFGYTELTDEIWTLYVVVSGSFRCTLNGKEEIVEQGDLYFIPPFVHFRRSVIEHLKVHFFAFEMQDGAQPPFPMPVGRVRLQDEVRLQGTLQMLKDLSAYPERAREGTVRHLLCDILYQYHFESEIALKKTLSDPTVLAVTEYFKQHYREKINMREVAETFGVSPSGLILKFRRTTGLLPTQHLCNIRINHAKHLLVDTSASLSEIAEKTGFDNCYYFSTAFKKEVGISPSEYRKAYAI